MKKDKTQSDEAADLRRRAEVRLVDKQSKPAQPLAKTDSLRLLHELEVHQIELEMQNEELRRANEKTEAGLLKYTDLYEFAPVGYFTVDSDGIIREANLTGASLLGEVHLRLIGRRMGLFVSVATRPVFNAFLKGILTGEGERTCEVVLDAGNPQRTVQIEAAVVESAQGSQVRMAVIDISVRKQAEAQLAQAYENEKRARKTAETLRQYSLALSRSLDIDVVLNTLLENLNQLVPFESANVMLLEGESSVVVRASYGDGQNCMSLPRGDTIDLHTNRFIRTVLAEQRSVIVADTTQEPDWEIQPDGGHVCGWAGVPLVVENKAIGLFSMDKAESGFFTQEHLQLAGAFAAQAAVAIQNAWLFNQVAAGRERLQSLSRRLVEIQEEERRYISRELHDEIGQSLTSLMVGLRLLEREAQDPQAVLAGIAGLKKMVEGILAELHRLAMDLRPASLDHLGLVAALRQYIESFSDKRFLAAQFEAVGLGDNRLQAGTEIALYRIVQEALTNVTRHARATRVDVLLARREDKVVLVVEDNGVGFDPEIALNGERLGLFGIRERAQMLGGMFTIESNPENGTTLIVEVPFANENPDRR